MPGRWMSSVPGHLAHVVRGRYWGRLMRVDTKRDERPDVDDQEQRRRRFQYHLGRGRRAREAGRFDSGVYEARRALAVNPQNPWALALLAQCLVRRPVPDLEGARMALERARALDPTNGYFVRLLLDVLDIQGDVRTRSDVLDWAWWSGAPVERWLPTGPRRPWEEDAQRSGAVERTTVAQTVQRRSPHGDRPRAGARWERQPASA